MKTEKRTKAVKIQDDVIHALNWLRDEYPNGVDLVYIDYRDSFDENLEALQKYLAEGYRESEMEWFGDAESDEVHNITEKYRREVEADELSDEVEEKMRDFLYSSNTSDPARAMLKNTGRKLFYVETPDYAEVNDKESLEVLTKKYARTEAQKKEIVSVINESFYSAPAQFYFYLDPETAVEVLHGKDREIEDVIIIDGAYFGTVDRGQGSNWLGDNAIFKIAIPRSAFLECVRLDRAKGNGYSWNEIAGQVSFDDAEISRAKAGTLADDVAIVIPEVSESAKREERLTRKWEQTKICTFGDMNINRHADTPYRNEFPCGNKCGVCGTFWID